MEHADTNGGPLPSRKRHRLSAADYTVACLFALEVELTPMLAMLDAIHEPPDLNYSSASIAYKCGEVGPHNLVLAVLPRVGNNDSGVVAHQLRNDFPSIHFGLLVGIAGGVPDPCLQTDIRLGDVVVSDWTDSTPGVVQFDRGKHRSGGFTRTGQLNQPPNLLLTALKTLRSQHRHEKPSITAFIKDMLTRFPNLSPTYEPPSASRDQLYDADYEHSGGLNCEQCDNSRIIKRPPRPADQPQIHYGILGSSNSVIRDGFERERLRQDIPGLLAVEMEAAGIMNTLPCIVIKGICDYADTHKSKSWQAYAAATASAFAKEVLQTMPRCKSTDPGTMSITMEPSQDTNQSLQDEQYQSKYEALFHSLTFDRMDARLRNVRDALPKTCKWLLRLPAFKKWTERIDLPQNKGFLWIKGKPGCGKSTLMKASHAWATRTWKNEIIVTYFFNARASGLLERSILGLYRSLTYQILQAVPSTRKHFFEIFNLKKRGDKIEEWTKEELESFWNHIIQNLQHQTINIFVDALDEGNIYDIRELVSFLEDLAEHAFHSSCNLRICLSSRHYPEIGLQDCISLVMENERGHERDIETYVKAKLQVDRSEEAEAFRQQVSRLSSGVFLWLVLVIPILNDHTLKGMPKERQKCLEELPKDLDGLFARILARNDLDLGCTDILLRWLLFSKQSLTLQELYLATKTTSDAINATEGCTNADEIIDSTVVKRFVLDNSRGLAELTKSSPPLVQFIHETVRTFLLENGMQQLNPRNAVDVEGQSHDMFAKACLLYLDVHVDEIDEELVYHVDPKQRKAHAQHISTRLPFSEYATDYLFEHCESAQVLGVNQEQLLSKIGQNELSGLKAYVKFHDCYQLYIVRTYKQCPPLLYLFAEKNLPELCALRLITGNDSINMISRLRYGNPLQAACANGAEQVVQLLISHDADVNYSGGEWGHALYAALFLKKDAIVETLVRHGARPSLQSLENRLYTMIARKNLSAIKTLLRLGASPNCQPVLRLGTLIYTIEKGPYIHIMRTLLEAGADVEQKNSKSQTALLIACQKGYVDVVRLLLKHGANVNRHGGDHGTALIAASVSNRTNIVDLLLKSGAQVNQIDRHHGTALIAASVSNHTDIVRLLLKSGANVNQMDKHYGTALRAASVHDNIDTVRLLLDSGAKVNQPDEHYGNALTAASVRGNTDIVRLLLNSGANANQRGGHYGTALRAASISNHTQIVRLLLNSGAEVNQVGEHYGTALTAASSYGRIDVVSLLLNSGAEVNKLGGNCGNALTAASERGYTDIVRLLLQSGAEVNQRSKHYGNALTAASARGSTDIVRLLLNSGAEVNQVGEHYGTALVAAALHGSKDIVRLLIDSGAQVNQPGGQYGNALTAASERGHTHIVDLLRNSGAEF